MKYLTANQTKDGNILMQNAIDLTGAAAVEVAYGKGVTGKPVLWINVEGVCLLRVCQIEHLIIDGVSK